MTAGVDANAINEAGRTALIVAAWRGHYKVLQTLASTGIDLDAADHQGRTALSWAAINGFSQVAQMLLREMATVEVRDESGLTPLIRAAWNGHEEIVKALIAEHDVNAADSRGITALQRTKTGNETAIIAHPRAAGPR